ncbi:MAG: glutathione S-transferase C-terminal domain-containing protein [Pseudomonadota bacterium]
MGLMIDGVYQVDEPPPATDANGHWSRSKSVVRHWVSADGKPGPTGDAGFKAEAGRYHLYVAWNCPWAHRALLALNFNALESIVDFSVALPRRSEQGWIFDPEGEFADRQFGVASLHEIYSKGVDGYTGRITVPVLWDKQTGSMVSNESADVVRMFNTAFADVAPESPDYYPPDLKDTIDHWNDRIYRTVNNGVYRAGFASTQEAYEEAAYEVFETLDAINERLGRTRYLTGDRLTEADIRLFPTLARFDVAYHYAFKCNLRRLVDYDNLWPYAREIYQMPGVAETVKFDIYKRGYHSPSEKRNPLGIVPIGPTVDWSAPNGRA